jgi:hypothetical protein
MVAQKFEVYKHRPRNLQELKHAIRQEVAAIPGKLREELWATSGKDFVNVLTMGDIIYRT